MENNTKTLPIISVKDATSRALKEVQTERSGEQTGLLSSIHSLNVSMGKYFRFNIVNLFAALSGHGKSYLLNKLSNDFTNEELNGNCIYEPIIVNFSFEMFSYVEVLRAAAADLNISYSYLLSSEYNPENRSYNTITDKELQQVEHFLKQYENKKILYIDVASNVVVIFNTIQRIYDNYCKDKKSKSGKPYKLVVNFDHTLLFEKLSERDVLELMSNIGKLSIKIKKEFEAMVNLLGQLNNKIEDVVRLTTPTLHYPQKSDIYAQAQLYNACDNVYVLHQPEQLGISFYGRRKIPTKQLMHLLKLKSRHGSIGSIWLKNLLHKGQIIEYDLNKTKKEEDLPDYDDEMLENLD